MIDLADRPPMVVELSDETIRLRDIVPAARGRSAELLIARLPAGRSEATLSTAALKALVRRAMPGLPVPHIGSAVRFRRPATAPAAHCFAAAVPIAIGASITQEMVIPGTCDGSAAKIRYEGGAVIATAPIAAGGNVGTMVSDIAVPSVSRGEALTLAARHGVVTVERDVIALQPGRDGGRVFVRDRDGHVFAVPVRVSAR